jgi:CHAT domain-containing protein
LERKKRSLPELGKQGLNDVAQVLKKHGMQDVTFIPYRNLSFFPLPAVLVSSPEGDARLDDLFTVTIAPSGFAKATALSRASAAVSSGRPLLLTVGNPQPLPEGISSLPYAQAEADTIRRIAEAYHYPHETVRYFRQREATRERVVEVLEKSWYAHLAVHGQYDPSTPVRSKIVLAGNKAVGQDQCNIYLSEALDGIINLTGLRLLVHSACETALIDTMFSLDEVIGLAAGFLQAGAAGVIASLVIQFPLARAVLFNECDHFHTLKILCPSQCGRLEELR